jgi:hypothetical protein
MFYTADYRLVEVMAVVVVAAAVDVVVACVFYAWQAMLFQFNIHMSVHR